MEEDIRQKLDILAVPMERVKFSREEYSRLFPAGKIKTPLGVVKLGNDQYQKLIRTKREYLLGAMRQTLAEPIVVLSEIQETRIVKLYIKSFKDEANGESAFVMTVVVKEHNDEVAISTGQRKKKQIEKKIKKAGSPLYVSPEGVAARLIGTGGNVSNHPTSLSSPITLKKSSGAEDLL
jgi:hypothetical protein